MAHMGFTVLLAAAPWSPHVAEGQAEIPQWLEPLLGKTVDVVLPSDADLPSWEPWCQGLEEKGVLAQTQVLSGERAYDVSLWSWGQAIARQRIEQLIQVTPQVIRWGDPRFGSLKPDEATAVMTRYLSRSALAREIQLLIRARRLWNHPSYRNARFVVMTRYLLAQEVQEVMAIPEQTESLSIVTLPPLVDTQELLPQMLGSYSTGQNFSTMGNKPQGKAASSALSVPTTLEGKMSTYKTLAESLIGHQQTPPDISEEPMGMVPWEPFGDMEPVVYHGRVVSIETQAETVVPLRDLHGGSDVIGVNISGASTERAPESPLHPDLEDKYSPQKQSNPSIFNRLQELARTFSVRGKRFKELPRKSKEVQPTNSTVLFVGVGTGMGQGKEICELSIYRSLMTELLRQGYGVKLWVGQDDAEVRHRLLGELGGDIYHHPRFQAMSRSWFIREGAVARLFPHWIHAPFQINTFPLLTVADRLLLLNTFFGLMPLMQDVIALDRYLENDRPKWVFGSFQSQILQMFYHASKQYHIPLKTIALQDSPLPDGAMAVGSGPSVHHVMVHDEVSMANLVNSGFPAELVEVLGDLRWDTQRDLLEQHRKAQGHHAEAVQTLRSRCRWVLAWVYPGRYQDYGEYTQQVMASLSTLVAENPTLGVVLVPQNKEDFYALCRNRPPVERMMLLQPGESIYENIAQFDGILSQDPEILTSGVMSKIPTLIVGNVSQFSAVYQFLKGYGVEHAQDVQAITSWIHKLCWDVTEAQRLQDAMGQFSTRFLEESIAHQLITRLNIDPAETLEIALARELSRDSHRRSSHSSVTPASMPLELNRDASTEEDTEGPD